MGTIKVDVILGKARKIINDAAAGSWSNQDLLDFFNTGQRTAVEVNNELGTTTGNLTCVAGSKQSVGARRLISVIRNMGADGSTPGRPIMKMDRTMMDSLIPGWHSLTPVDDALFYMTDEDGNTFYLYPPIKADQKIEVARVVVPSDVALGSIASASIAIDDTMEGALIDYICARAFSFVAELPGAAARSQTHMQAFYAAIGMDAEAAKIEATTKAAKK